MLQLGRALKRQRLLRGLKQSHVAELLSVTQATVSRWERGIHPPSPAQRQALMALIGGPPPGGGDAALRRLVESSSQRVHLIRDESHHLLAASPARTAEWGAPAGALIGRSLWPFASPAIAAAEARLDELGWRDGAVRAVAFRTQATRDPVVPIAPGVVLWERMRLEDGSEVRLVSTLAAAAPLPPDVVRI